MTKIRIKKLIFLFFLADIFVVIFSYFKGFNFFISSQVGFISSVLITLSSFWGYKKLVQHKLSIGDIPKDDIDELDKIDDKFDLYDDEKKEAKDFREVIAMEKARQKGFKSSAKNLQKSFFATISPLRLFSYIFLILSFLYLNTHHLLDIFGLFLGLGVVSFVSLSAGFLYPAKD